MTIFWPVLISLNILAALGIGYILWSLRHVS